MALGGQAPIRVSSVSSRRHYLSLFDGGGGYDVAWTISPGAGRLRIAMISTPYVAVPPARYGGTELVVSELVNGLALRGHEVELFATGDSTAPCAVRSHFATPMWPPDPLTEMIHSAWALQAIRKAARRFDLVHAHVATLLPFVPLLGRIPVVFTVHHDRDERLARFYEGISPAVHYVTISHRQAALFPELRRSTVIHHGLNPDIYPFGASGRGHVAFLGRYSELKGPDTAIGVAGRLGKPLHMAGKPHEEDAAFYRGVLEALLQKPWVRDFGELGHGPKTAMLAGADALLFPIRWEEPFGLVMIESMLCGTPVVAFRGGAVEEVVDHGITGFLAEDEDDMVRLVRDEVPRLDRREVRGRAIERFSSQRMVGDYLDVYEQAIAMSGQLVRVPQLEVATR
jgi:glycosyltransferase involved in cell wall biosynthesis